MIFSPKHPVTNPKLEDVLAEEEKIENYDEILEKSLKLGSFSISDKITCVKRRV